MKKLTSVAAFLLAMMMLVSCGGTATPNATSKTAPGDEVRTTITSFMDSILSFDIDKAKSYTSYEEIVTELENRLNIDNFMSAFEEAAGSVIPIDKIKDSLSAFTKKLFQSVKYDISSVSVNGNTATADVTLTVPNFDAIDMDSAGVDLQSLMVEAFGFDITSDITTFMQKYAEKKGISMDELMTKFGSDDQSDLMSDLFDTFSEEFNKFFDLMGDAIVKAVETAGTTDTTSKLKIENTDGSWKITEWE